MPATEVPAAGRKFLKEVLRPGTYGKSGHRVEVTFQDIKDYHASNAQLMQTGLKQPLILEHPRPDRTDNEGMPYDEREAKADQLRNTKGNVDWTDPRTNRINASGALEMVFDVPDAETAAQLADGRIEFVSPELWPWWRSGKGKEFKKVISHYALTHKPIQHDQRPGFVQLSHANDVVQLSLADLEKTMAKPKQLADDEAEKPFESPPKEADEAPAKPDENPDMPSGAPEKNKQLEALIAQLALDGYALPSDTDESNLVERLLTASMTKNAAKAAAEEDAAKDDEGDPAQELAPDTSLGAQFSSDVAREVGRIQRIRKEGKLQPGQADKMLGMFGSLQLSDGPEVKSGLTMLTKVLDVIDAGGSNVMAGILADQTADYVAQLSDARPAQHPRGEEFFKGEDPAAKVDDAVEQMLERNGLGKSGKGKATAINASAV